MMGTSFKITNILLLICLVCFSHLHAVAQKQDSTVYPVVVQFQSVCCGVPTSAPLKKYINSFKKTYKIKRILAWHIGPLGKEGEYWLAFPLKELNKKQTAVFTKQLKTVTEKMKDKGAANLEIQLMVVDADLPGRSTMEKVVF